MSGPYASEAPYAFDLGVKSVVTEEDGDLILEGWASTVDEDFQAEAFEPDAWNQSVIDEFLKGPAPCLANHDADRPLGRIVSAEIRPKGLWIKALIPKPSPGSWADREDWYSKLKRNLIRGMSVSGVFSRRKGADGRTRIWKSTLAEISITPHPVNRAAIGTVSLASVGRKAFATETDATKGQTMSRELEALRRDCADLRKALTERQPERTATKAQTDLGDPRGYQYVTPSGEAPVTHHSAEAVAIARHEIAQRAAAEPKYGTVIDPTAGHGDWAAALRGGPVRPAESRQALKPDGTVSVRDLFGYRPAPTPTPRALKPEEIFKAQEDEARAKEIRDGLDAALRAKETGR